MKKNILLHSILLSILTVAYADEADTGKEIESLINDISEIATKKSLNVDYLPSVVTIIDAQTYRDAGIQTVSEALDMLPSFQIQLSPTGYSMTTVRGLKNPNAYLSDKVKVLIDGVAINNEVQGSTHFYMDFPMQLVEKIEVLRGPNSTLYGSGAFYGTINIITKLGKGLKDSQLYAGTGNYQYQTVGTNINTSLGNWKFFADGYYKQNDKALDVKNETRKTDEAMKDYSVGFKATNENFEFLTRLKQNTYGNFYSYEGLLNPIPQSDEYHKNSYFFSQLSYKTAFDDYKLETKASFSHRELDQKDNMTSIAEIAGFFSVVGINMQDGFYTVQKSTEENLEAEAILTLPQIYSNDILIGAGARQAKVTHDEFYSSIEAVIMQNYNDIYLYDLTHNDFRYNAVNESAFWNNPTTTLLPKGIDREITYGYVQDLISVTKDMDLILGLRADHYSDYGMQLNKRAGLVYRASDSTILKFLYGSAFRVPTLIEAYQNGHINTRAGESTIQPEKTDTYEIVGIYTPNFNHKFSLDLFYSQLKNVIDLEELPYTDPGYQNFKQRYSQGVEFEYFYHAGQEHNLYFNATYLDTHYTLAAEPTIRYYGDGTSVATDGRGTLDENMPDISKVMLKGMYVYRPADKLSFGTSWRYFSKTTPSQLVTQDTSVDEVHIFDETVTYRFSPSSELQLTVKNLFDADVYQPSYYYQVAGGIKREGRNFFLTYVQKF
ncbi:TonB-dependent receptor plug domain-containing protein [Sulfuricurvum sp.]|uniref:TonB-dependent receptor plug domain-containing protein n=1 Tax=Sulfuricurvum sp. TaxID=2025608 RepID=UPI003BB0E587